MQNGTTDHSITLSDFGQAWLLVGKLKLYQCIYKNMEHQFIGCVRFGFKIKAWNWLCTAVLNVISWMQFFKDCHLSPRSYNICTVAYTVCLRLYTCQCVHDHSCMQWRIILYSSESTHTVPIYRVRLEFILKSLSGSDKHVLQLDHNVQRRCRPGFGEKGVKEST